MKKNPGRKQRRRAMKQAGLLHGTIFQVTAYAMKRGRTLDLGLIEGNLVKNMI